MLIGTGCNSDTPLQNSNFIDLYCKHVKSSMTIACWQAIIHSSTSWKARYKASTSRNTKQHPQWFEIFFKKNGTVQHLFVYSKTRLSLASVSLLSSAILILASRSDWFFCLWLYFWSLSLRRAERTKLGWTNSGFSNTVGPPNEPSKIRMGVRQKRGPISTNEMSSLSKGSKPGVFVAFFSTIYTASRSISTAPHLLLAKPTW